MFNYLVLIFISSHCLLLTTCLIIHTQRAKENEEICVKNNFPTISINNLHVCYINNNRDHSILVWFRINKILFNLFHFYRFILRSIDEASLSTINIHMLTNFTELIDLNNSLRIFNLDSGQYEICLDFQSNVTKYIYSPRNGCISIRLGEFLHRSFRQSSTQLFIALVTGIILFLILGLVVQWIKTTKIQKQLSNENKTKSSEENPEQRSRSSSILSTVPLRKQRDRIARKLFRRHIDQPDPSRLRQWARNRAFRHRISTQEQEIEQWNNQILTTTSQTNHSSSTTNDIYIIPMNECSRKISFYLNPSEEFELL